MRNAKKCGCSFNQEREGSSCVGERIRVNQSCNSCDREERVRESRSECQNSCRPRSCPQPQPCPQRPCPSCEERCASQYRNCMRNCRWDDDCNCRGRRSGCDVEKEDEDCDCRGKRPCHDNDFDCDFDRDDK